MLKCLVALHLFILLSFMLSLAVTPFPVKTLGKRKTGRLQYMPEICQAFHTNHQQSIFFNALRDL